MQTIRIISKEVEFPFTAKSLSLFELISLPLFKEALLLKRSYNKKIFVSVIYRFRSQNKNLFNLLLSNLEIFLSKVNKCKSSLSVVTGDVTVRFFYWWCKDINTTEGLNLFSLMSSNGFSK